MKTFSKAGISYSEIRKMRLLLYLNGYTLISDYGGLYTRIIPIAKEE